jgi:hypothetical protein
MTKPDSVLPALTTMGMEALPPACTVPKAEPPTLTVRVPPLLTVVMLASPPEKTYSWPLETRVVLIAVPPDATSRLVTPI